jgi:thiamine biosynthesis lipoprotein
MFKFLLGRALVRWLEGMAPEEQATAPEPKPAPVPAPPPPEPVYPRVQRRAMGSLFEIYMAGTDRESLVAAGEEALDEVERLERQLSHYLPDSDVSRLNMHAREQWVRLEPKLYDLLKRCAALRAETEGAFDITAGPLVKAWGFFRGEGRIPSNDELTAALENVGSNRILFDDEDHLVYFTAPGLEINLGAVGKGVAVDAAAETLRFFGVENAVIHGGGSTIYAMGEPPEEADTETGRQGDKETTAGGEPIRNPQSAIRNQGWRFDIKDPRDGETVIEAVWLKGEAISTSGNYEQFFEVDGVRYSHILDPRTGRPTQGMIGVSVIGPNAEETDALSTAFFVLGREATEEYCKTRPNIRVILIEEAEDGGIRVSRIGFPPRPHPPQILDTD